MQCQFSCELLLPKRQGISLYFCQNKHLESQNLSQTWSVFSFWYGPCHLISYIDSISYIIFLRYFKSHCDTSLLPNCLWGNGLLRKGKHTETRISEHLLTSGTILGIQLTLSYLIFITTVFCRWENRDCVYTHTHAHTQFIGIYIDTIKPYIKKSQGVENTGFRMMVTLCEGRQAKEW